MTHTIKQITTIALLSLTSLAQAAPSLNQVTNGNATVTQNAGDTTINQTSASATIDWHSFNTTQHQTVVFNQPNTQSLTVNNILDANPTTIHGSITANGRIILLNPNGFFFGANSSVSAHTFIAAATTNSNTSYNSLTNTLSIINNDAINGTITVDGTITATKTQLIAKRVAANDTATVNATGAITITATQDATLHGTLSATAGNIDIFSNGSIRGSADTSATNTTFNASGELSLSGTHTATNTLTLNASPLFLESTATLNAASLTITSPHSFALVSATTNAHTQLYTANTSLTFINANINSTAGTITIGNKTTPTITINPTTTITNNATTSTTNAGDIIIFSKDHTQFYGTATATAEYGNGGLIELSSKGTITHSTPLNISTTSTYGNTGTLLIDPAVILIADPATFNTFNSFRALLTGGTADPSAAQADARFGYSVALSSTHALIGAYDYHYSGNNDSGNAFLYNLSTNTWTNLLATTNAPVLANAQFGYSVALSSTYALIGANRYRYNNTNNSGNAFLYHIENNTWTNLFATTNAPVQAGARFGSAVALNDTYALIGASFASSSRGRAYLYRLDGTNGFTSTCATTGAPLTSLWCNLSSSPGHPIGGLAEDSSFGTSVALNDTYALIGANGVGVPPSIFNRGNAWLYRLDGTNGFTANCATTGESLNSPWCNLSASSMQPITALGSDILIGTSVALNDTYALIGATGARDDDDLISSQGDAYLYRLDGTNSFDANCATTGTLTSPWCTLSSASPTTQPITALLAFSFFGASVALNDTYAIIGATGVSSNRGNAYLYRLDGTNSFDANCATTPSSLTSPWCTLSSSTGQPITALSSTSSFGRSVALNDTYALIGADRVSSNRGNAFLYNISSGAWTDLISNANAPRAQAGAQFGESVALSSTHALIGAPFYDYNSGTATTNSGNAYLYNLSNNTWTNLLATSGAPGAQAEARFGFSVALSSTYALIGAHFYDYSSNTNSGNAYLYTLSTGAWTGTNGLLSTTNAPLQAFDAFGFSVALSSAYALIGAIGYDFSSSATNSGNAYLYNLSGGSNAWTNLATTTNAPTAQAGAFFGSSVALSSTYALIGADAYDYPTLGTSCDEDALLASSTCNTGNAYLYNLSGGSNAWTNLLASTDAPSAQEGAQFGYSVALNSTHALIGAQNYDYPTLGSLCGVSGITINDTCNTGSAFLYRISDGNWTNLLASTGAPSAQAGAQFGWSVALTSTHALIGAVSHDHSSTGNSGNAFLYRFSDGDWTDLLATSGAPATQVSAFFGNSVALTSTHALVGADEYDHLTNSNSGNAWLFTLAPATDTPAFDLSATPASILTALAATNVSYTATNAIYIYNSIDLSSYTGTNTLTLRAPNIIFNLSSATDRVGAATGTINHDVIIERPANSGPWTASNLTLPTNGGTYLRTTTPGVLSGISSSAQGEIVITNPTTDLTISNSLTAPNLTLSIAASMGSIDFGNSAISVANFIAVSTTGSITGDTITANILGLSATMGSIGISTNPLTIVRSTPDTTWSSTNLALTASGSIYLTTAAAGAHTRIPTNFGGTFSLNQTMGNIAITSPINFSSATIILNASGTSANITSTGTLTANAITLIASNGSIGTSTDSITIARSTGDWTADNLTLTAGNNIYLTTAGVGTLSGTLTADTLTLSTTGDIGALLDRLTIARSTPDTTWSSTNLSLTAGGNIYLETAFAGAHTAIPSGLGNSTFSLLQTADNINITSEIDLENATIIFNASGTTANISFAANDITASSLSLTATGTLTGTGTITADSITLSTTGALGISTNPLTIVRSTPDTTWSSTNLALTASGSIYLTTAAAGAHTRIPTNFGGTFSLNQTMGNIAITSPINFSSATIILNASGTSANITSTGTLTANAITLIASNGSIGTSTDSITIARSTGDWTADNLTLTAGNNIYLTTAGVGTLSGTLTADTLTLSTTGDIGALLDPLTIVRSTPDTTWSSTNLALTASGSIYLTTAAAGAHTRIPTNFGGTFSLNQTMGNIAITSPINFSSATIILNASGTSANITSTGTLTANAITLIASNGSIGTSTDSITIARSTGDWTADNLTLTAGNNIYLTTAGVGTLSGTLTADTLTLSTTGDIGALLDRLTIARSTPDTTWSSTNLSLTAGGNIYLETAFAGAHTAIPSGLGNSTFSLLQTADNINITSEIDLENATIIFNASGTTANISFAANDITASSLSLTATGTLTGTGTITADSITLSTTGALGISTNPLTIVRSTPDTTWSSTNLALTASGSIYLTTAAAGAHTRIPTNFGGTFSLNQTMGNIAITSPINFSSATIILNASGTSANITSTGTLTANAITLIASNGSIGTSTDSITIARSTGDWTADNLTLTAGNNIYLTTAGVGTLSGTLTADTLTLSTTGDIGALLDRLTIARSTPDTTWSSTNLSLTAGGNIYLETAFAGAHTAIPSGFTNAFLLTQTAGNIAITSPINLPSATISLGASVVGANIDFAANNLTVSSLAFITSGTITGTGTLTADSISFISTGNIGTEDNPFIIARNTAGTTWSASNLSLTAGNNIYLTTAFAGAHLAIPGGFGNGTFSLNQTMGNIDITTINIGGAMVSPINLPNATIILNASGTGANITSTTTLTANAITLIASNGSIGTSTDSITVARSSGVWTADNLTLTAGSNIYLTTAGAGALSGTLTADDITLSTSGALGTSANPITIARSTAATTWTADNLTLTAGSHIYLTTAAAGAHLAIPSGLGSNTFSLNQTAGSIAISPINLSSATIIFNSSGTGAGISFATNAITVSSLSLMTTGTLTGTGTITADSITLSTSGAIGTEDDPLTIVRRTADTTWSSTNLSLTAGNSIYLETAAAFTNLTLPSSFAHTFSLNQTAGNLAIASVINATSATIELEASGTNADISLSTSTITANSFSATATGNITGGTITAGTIMLTASNGSIGTANNRIRIRARGATFNTDNDAVGFMAMANNTADNITGNVYLSTNNNALVGFVRSMTPMRMVGDGDLSITLESVPVKPVVAGGVFADILGPIIEIFGAGCDKDDTLSTLLSVGGILCGPE